MNAAPSTAEVILITGSSDHYTVRYARALAEDGHIAYGSTPST